MQQSAGVASDYITTTIRFLEDTFRAFTNLPVRISIVFFSFAFYSLNYFLETSKSRKLNSHENIKINYHP